MKANELNAAGSHRAVLAELLRSLQTTRSDLIAATQLSAATVSRAVEAFVAAGLVREIDDSRRGARGRPRVMLEIDGSFAHVAGVDLGASSARFVILDLAAKLVRCVETSTPSGLAPGRLADWIADTLSDLQEHSDDLDRVAVGLPGAVHAATWTVTNAPNLPQVEDAAFATRLEQRLGVSIGLDNDANYALLGEQKFGAAVNARTVGMLTAGAGLGGAVAIDDHVLQGTHGVVGEFGHLPVGPLGTRLETVVAGPTLIARAAELGAPIDSPADLFGKQAPAQLEPLATQFDNALLVALTALVVSADPEMIVLGGGIAKSLAPRLQRYEYELERNLSFHVPLAIAKLGDFSGATGAAASALQSLYREIGVPEDMSVALPHKLHRPSPGTSYPDSRRR